MGLFMDCMHISTREAAELIGLTYSRFHARRRYLRRINFPEPLPWNKRRYSRQSVIDWFEATQTVEDLSDNPDESGKIIALPVSKKITAARCGKRGTERARERRHLP